MCFRVYMNARSSGKTLTRETPADILKSNLHGSLFTFMSKVKKKKIIQMVFLQKKSLYNL